MGATASATTTSQTPSVASARSSPRNGSGDGIDETVNGIEQLYQSITGRQPAPFSETAESSLPPERDPGQYVQSRLEQLLMMLGAGDSRPAAWTPPVAVWRAAQELVITVDLPGMAREDLQLEVTGNTLTVTGRREPPALPGMERAQLTVAEQPWGAVRRTVVLPATADAEQLVARMQDGVLSLRVPITEPAAAVPRDIPVA